VNSIQEKLLFEAKKAANLSYSPYSKFRVGAAVYADGNIYHGANIENASSNLGICAERVALAYAKMNGAKHIEGIAVFCIDAAKEKNGKYSLEQSLPCGGCLQWISELAPTAWIITNATTEPFNISELLPKPFKLITA